MGRGGAKNKHIAEGGPDSLGNAMLHAFGSAPALQADKNSKYQVFGVPSNKLMDQSTLVGFLKSVSERLKTIETMVKPPPKLDMHHITSGMVRPASSRFIAVTLRCCARPTTQYLSARRPSSFATPVSRHAHCM